MSACVRSSEPSGPSQLFAFDPASRNCELLYSPSGGGVDEASLTPEERLRRERLRERGLVRALLCAPLKRTRISSQTDRQLRRRSRHSSAPDTALAPVSCKSGGFPSSPTTAPARPVIVSIHLTGSHCPRIEPQGVTRYFWAKSMPRLLVPMPNGIYVADVSPPGAAPPPPQQHPSGSAAMRLVLGSDPAHPVLDPQLSPDGAGAAGAPPLLPTLPHAPLPLPTCALTAAPSPTLVAQRR